MKYSFVLLILLLQLDSKAQKSYDPSAISTRTLQIVSKIEKVNMLMGGAVGYAGERPAQYDNFVQLKDNAGPAELSLLVEHPNPVVRCYSFWALAYHRESDLFPIVVGHLNDTASFSTQFGCLVSGDRVGDFFISVVTPEYVDLDVKKLDSLQRAQLDSLLIYSDNSLHAKSGAIERAALTEKLYSRLRELYLATSDGTALVTLAKYNKEQDTELILSDTAKKDLFYTFRAIKNFPHDSFFPFLKRQVLATLPDDHYDTDWSELYSAVAAYKNSAALTLLRVPFTKVKHRDIRPYHIGYVYDAIQDNMHPIYDSLLWVIWKDEKLISAKVFDYLWHVDEVKAYQLIKETFQHAKDYEITKFSYDYDSSKSVADLMLEILSERDKQYYINVISDRLANAAVIEFLGYSRTAKANLQEAYVQPLIKRLIREDNPHVYLEIVRILISYQQPAVNRKIIQARQINRNLTTDWGGKDLDKLLKQEGLL